MSVRSASPALAAALLFGASTPFAKLLVGDVPPLLLAGLLYLGSGIGLGALLAIRQLWDRPDQAPAVGISKKDIPDRESTRLNSSHLVISYAVFCFEKKK